MERDWVAHPSHRLPGQSRLGLVVAVEPTLEAGVGLGYQVLVVVGVEPTIELEVGFGYRVLVDVAVEPTLEPGVGVGYRVLVDAWPGLWLPRPSCCMNPVKSGISDSTRQSASRVAIE